jgi:hypothetical protein
MVSFAERCHYAVRSDWHLNSIKVVSEVAFDEVLCDCTSYEAFFMFVGQLLQGPAAGFRK